MFGQELEGYADKIGEGSYWDQVDDLNKSLIDKGHQPINVFSVPGKI